MNFVSLVAGEDWEAEWRERLLELGPELDGIVLVGVESSLACELRRESPVPVVDLWEAAESYFRLSGIPFERLKACGEREEDPAARADGTMSGVQWQEEQKARPQVLLLEDLELLPDLHKEEKKCALPVTDGIGEGMLMIGALLGEDGMRLRGRLWEARRWHDGTRKS